MYKVIIFDFDRTIGTLVVDWTTWRKSIKDLVLEFEPDSDIKLEDIKHANQNELIQKYGSEFRERLNRINEQSELTLVTNFVVNKAVLDYIKNTDSQLYCWSSNSRKTLNKYFSEMGVIDRFKKIISREDTNLLKPDNEGFKLIYDHEVPLEQYLFVGDSEADKVAAEKSEISFMHIDDFDLKI